VQGGTTWETGCCVLSVGEDAVQMMTTRSECVLAGLAARIVQFDR
jgi:hypothetical protein